MHKELDIFLRASAIFFVASATACGRVVQENQNQDSTPTPEVSPTPTAFQPIRTSTPIVTPFPLETPSLTPTPELTFIRGGIDFGKEGEFSLSIEKPFKYSTFGKIVVYPDIIPTSTPDNTGVINTQTPKELATQQAIWLNENFRPGGGTIVSEIDSLGNGILFFHDGYTNKRGNEGEGVRKNIEGFTGKTINDPDHIKYTMQSLIGAKINITQAEVSSDFEIEAIVQVPAQQVNSYNNNTNDLFENVYLISQMEGTNKTDGATEVIEEHIKSGGGFAISICGWGVVGLDSKGKEIINTQATRYVIFLK